MNMITQNSKTEIHPEKLIEVRQELETQIEAAQSAIENINKILDVLGIGLEKPNKKNDDRTSSQNEDYISIKDLVQEALKSRKADTNEILEFAKEKHGMDINKGSLSSILSKMKSSKEVSYDEKTNKYSLHKKAA